MPKFLASVDMTQREIQRAVTHPLASAPTSPIEGQDYYDTTLKLERYWNGTTWVTPGNGMPAGGLLGQALTKKTGTDFDTQWSNLPTGIERFISATPNVTVNPGATTNVDIATFTAGATGQMIVDLTVQLDWMSGGTQLTAVDLGPSTPAPTTFPGPGIIEDVGITVLPITAVWNNVTAGQSVTLRIAVGVGTTGMSPIKVGQVYGTYRIAGVGDSGAFLPVGGTSGQALVKNSGANYDATWQDVAAGGVSSVDGRTGVVTLADKYVDVTGDNMTGNLGLDFPSPTSKLQFAAATNAAGGIGFGTDVNLYRQGPDVLWTDDSMRVLGLGVNIAPPAGQKVSVAQYTSHASGGGNYSLRASNTWTSAVNATSYIEGNTFLVTTNLDAAATLTNAASEAVSALKGQVAVNGDGTYATNVNGVFGQITKTGAGVLSQAKAFMAYGPSSAGGGTITTAIGFDVQTQKVTGVTNGYGVYQRGAADYNYFNGYIGLGVTVPTAKLNLAADTTAAGGILFGTDTNLYRTGADSLKTDDSLTVGGTLNVNTAMTAPILTGTQNTTSVNAFAAGTALSAKQLSATANNWTELAFLNSTGLVAGIGVKHIDQANRYGDMYSYVRSAAGWYPRLKIPSIGGLDIYGDSNSVVASATNAGTLTALAGFRHGDTTKPSWTIGTGTPEGVVTAPIGSLFSRTDGGTGTTLYRKESGTGNTGWVSATAGATGPQGDPGPTGPAGSPGTTGPAGPGVPVGGAATQKLRKGSSTNYDVQWIQPWVENAFVGPSAPAGTPSVGDVWYDSDDVSALVLPMSVVNGGTGGTSPSSARSALALSAIGNSTVTAGAPTTGTWARGDRWIDSGGYEWICTVAGTPGTWYSPPRGVIAYIDSAVAQTGIATTQTDITGLVTPTIALVSGRRYELAAQVTFFKPSTAANVELWITESNNYGWQQSVNWVAAPGHVTSNISVLTASNLSGNYVFKCRALTDNGTVNVLTNRHWLRVTDVGTGVP